MSTSSRLLQEAEDLNIPFSQLKKITHLQIEVTKSSEKKMIATKIITSEVRWKKLQTLGI